MSETLDKKFTGRGPIFVKLEGMERRVGVTIAPGDPLSNAVRQAASMLIPRFVAGNLNDQFEIVEDNTSTTGYLVIRKKGG